MKDEIKNKIVFILIRSFTIYGVVMFVLNIIYGRVVPELYLVVVIFIALILSNIVFYKLSEDFKDER